MGVSKGDVARHAGAWVLGVAAAGLPWLAIRLVPVEVNKWASIYIAGALGGLALELLLGRGRIELPSPSGATEEEQKGDERRPLGPMIDLGFFARVSSSGIAAVALLLVYHALVDTTTTLEAFNRLAADPSTFGWAVFLGASSPAIWTASQRMVQARIDAVTAANKADLEQKNKTLKLAHEELAKSGVATGGGGVEPAEGAGRRVLTDIKRVVGEAARADPDSVDVPELSLNLFGSIQPLVVPAAAETSRADLASVNRVLGILEAGMTKEPE